MMNSSGTNTSLPRVEPFMNGIESGQWRGPCSTPGVAVGISAQVMPSSRSPPSSSSGSWSLNARPSSVATEESVM